MTQFWKIEKSKKNNLILIKENCIYKGNLKESDLKQLNSKTTDFDILKNLFSIPYSYIKKIEKQKGKNFIKIYYGDSSEEELYVDDENIKDEIFNYIKLEHKNLTFKKEYPSILKYAKSQFFAILFLTGIFIWSVYLAIQIEKGYQYEIVGNGAGITSIVLVIANLGLINIIIGYLVLMIVIVLSILKKLKSRSEIEILCSQTKTF